MGQCVRTCKHSRSAQGQAAAVCLRWCYQAKLVSRDSTCVTVSACLLWCLLIQQLKVNMWPRRVLCISAGLRLHTFIIADAGSHPAWAEFILNSPELTETMKCYRNTGKGASLIHVLPLKSHVSLVFRFDSCIEGCHWLIFLSKRTVWYSVIFCVCGSRYVINMAVTLAWKGFIIKSRPGHIDSCSRDSF